MSSSTLEYTGSDDLRAIIVLSTLSGHAVRLKDIRPFDDNPGLFDFEISFLRLVQSVSNGAVVDVNHTGTELFYRPGLLHGGSVTHDCGTERAIGYFLEGLTYLAPFCRCPLKVKLSGITNDKHDNSVDAVKAGFLSVLKRFYLDDEGLEVKVAKRGLRPKGGGEVLFTAPICKQLRTVQLTGVGKVKKIRGVSYACKVSPTISNRMIEAAKVVFAPLIKDVYVYSDHKKGPASGNSPGFGLFLAAECTNGVFYVAEALSNPVGEGTPLSPEEIGETAAKNLLTKIFVGGNCDETAQSLAVLLMALGQKDVSKLDSGSLTDFTVRFLRILRDFLNVTFKIDSQKLTDEEKEVKSEKLHLLCVGVGYSNLSRVLV